MNGVAVPPAAAAVDRLCRSYLDLRWHFDPAAASSAGVTSEDARLGRFDAESVRAQVAALRSVAGAVEALDVEDLQAEIDRTALLGEVRSMVERLERERPHERNPVFWLGHVLDGLYAMLVRDTPDLPSRVPAALARLTDMPAFLEVARATISKPPSVFVDTALAMLGGAGELIAQVAVTYGREMPALAEPLNAAATAALQALKVFGAALRDDIAPADDPLAFAIGEERFTRRLLDEHALGASPAELYRYGERLVAETDAALVEEARGFGRPWRELVEGWREATPEAGALLPFYATEISRAREFVKSRNLVAVPSTPLDIVPTPSFLAPLMPFAAYQPPPTELRTPTGRFYVTRPDPSLPADAQARQLRGHPLHGIAAIVVHEAYPGHHLQLSAAHGLRSEVRRHLWTPVMVEGWALYCEQLMEEEGYYDGPPARVYRLVNLLWRAARIVVDVALHTRGMTPGAAVDYMLSHLPMERASAEAEVRRYCAYPTYQLCYAVGRRDLLALRDDYRARAGATFSLRQFHDELLCYGGLPVSLARWGMGLAA